MLRRSLAVFAVAAGAAFLFVEMSQAEATVRRVYVNCQTGTGSRIHFVRKQHPAYCNMWGYPGDLESVVELRRGHWQGWGASTAVVHGREANTHEGMGGPATFPFAGRLYRVRRGCHARLYYTRLKNHGNPQPLKLSDACKPSAFY